MEHIQGFSILFINRYKKWGYSLVAEHCLACGRPWVLFLALLEKKEKVARLTGAVAQW
jgi:hypothetical protein